MAVLAIIVALFGGYFWGHISAKSSADDDVSRLTRELSSECQAEVNRASEAHYWHQDAKRDAYRGHSRY